MSDTNDDDEETKPPNVTGSPERIWLQYGDIEHDCTHDECYRDGEISWCQHAVFDSDVEYVRAGALEEQAATIAEQAAQIEALRADAERLRDLLMDFKQALRYHQEQTRPVFATIGLLNRLDAALQASEGKP